MSEYLTKLRDGAYACLNNAKRLLEDAQVLFERNSYLSCFLLSQLSLEELAKGFQLIEKQLKKEIFTREEWNSLTKYRNSHVKKLKYLQEVEDQWTEECIRGMMNLSYIELLRQIVSKVSWANNLDEYRAKISRAFYNFRLDSLYLDYDWEKKQWIEPANHPIFDGVFIDENICIFSIRRAENLLQVLMAKLQTKNEEQK